MISTKYATVSLVHNVAEAAHNKANSGARLTTGLRVANARDNASSFAIAQGLRSKMRGQTAVLQGINSTKCAMKTALAGANAIGEILAQMRAKAIEASSPGITNRQKDSLTDQLRDLTLQIDQIATSARFNGINLLVESRSDLDSNTFDVSAQLSTSRPSLAAAGDVDGDDDIDLVYSNSTNEIALLSNDGSGTFTASDLQAATGSTAYTRPVLADFDGDGDNDLVMGIYTSAASGSAAEYFENDGSGAFTSTGVIADAPARNGASGQFNEDLMSGDIDNNGRPDLVSIDQNGNPVTLLSNGDGSFTGVTSTLSPTLSDSDGNGILTTGFSIGDVDGDGNIDIMVQDQDGDQMILGLGDGSGEFDFSNGKTVALDSQVQTAHLSDLDNDGNLDLLVARYNYLETFTGDGNGNFTEVEELATDAVHRTNGLSAVADLNDDGIKDYISSSRDDATVSVFQGDGDGSFTLAENISVSGRGFGVSSGDFDGDGATDFAVGTNTGGTVDIFLNANPDSVNTAQTVTVLTSTDGESQTITYQSMQAHNFDLDWETIKEDPSGQLATIEAAIIRHQRQVTNLGAELRNLEANHDFQSQIADATASKVGNMVDVDIAREAAAFTAAQVREQLATQSLSIANDQPRLLLNLFR